MGHMQVQSCLNMAFATKDILKVEEEDSDHQDFTRWLFS